MAHECEYYQLGKLKDEVEAQKDAGKVLASPMHVLPWADQYTHRAVPPHQPAPCNPMHTHKVVFGTPVCHSTSNCCTPPPTTHNPLAKLG